MLFSIENKYYLSSRFWKMNMVVKSIEHKCAGEMQEGFQRNNNSLLAQ